MRVRGKSGTRLIVAALLAAAAAAAADTPVRLKIRNGQSALTDIDVILSAANGGKKTIGTSDGDGEVTIDAPALPDPRYLVTLKECTDRREVIIAELSAPPERDCRDEDPEPRMGPGPDPDRDCDCTPFAIDIGRRRQVNVNFGPRNVNTSGGGGIGTVGKVGIGAGAATAIGTIIGSRGSSRTSTPVTTQPPPVTTTPPPTTPPPTTPPPTTPPPTTPPPTISTAGGTYVVTVLITSDPNGHNPFTQYDRVTMLVVTINGSNISITGPSPWVTVNGTIDLGTGRFSASGRGTVAGRSNVPVLVEGTLSFDGATARMSGSAVVGGQGSLPGSQDDGRVRYGVNGTRQ